MYISQHNGGYVDADNGSIYKINSADANSPDQLWWVEVYNPTWGANGFRLGEGYADKAEAQLALDEFMTAHEVGRLAMPVSAEAQQADPDAPAIEKTDSTSASNTTGNPATTPTAPTTTTPVKGGSK